VSNRQIETINIELFDVTFSPKITYTNGGMGGTLGRLSFPAKHLPDEVQVEIKATIERAYRKQFLGENVE